MREDLTRLSLACGEVVLVTLLEEGEMARLGLADLLDRAKRSGFECLRFPIPDGTAPSNVEATALLVARMLERLAAGRTVIVHCLGGVGRSGTIAACTLVGAGRDPGEALDLVRAARAAAATAPGQEAFVYEFARAWARGTDTPRPDAPRGGR
jgi:protein-tyrosine phosphatase